MYFLHPWRQTSCFMGTLKNIILMALDERDESVWNLIP